MNIIVKVLRELISELTRRGRIELCPGATEEQLVVELLARMERAPMFAQVGPFLGKALEESRLVDEVYADDHELVGLLDQLRV